jgi:hypothetical protein
MVAEATSNSHPLTPPQYSRLVRPSNLKYVLPDIFILLQELCLTPNDRLLLSQTIVQMYFPKATPLVGSHAPYLAAFGL